MVIEAERRVYEEYYANVHRGGHTLSQKATDAYEATRAKLQRFIGAKEPRNIFVRGATERQPRGPAYGARGQDGDEILISGLAPFEHRGMAMLCERRGAHFAWRDHDRGEILLDELDGLMHFRTRSSRNTCRTRWAREPVSGSFGGPCARAFLVDGAQAVQHGSEGGVP